MRRFILIDPCLGDRGSHPYQCCLDILSAAARAGFACEAVVRREFPEGDGDWPAGYGLERVLDVAGYSKYTAFGELDRLRSDGSPRWRLGFPWAARHAERRREEHVASCARAMAAVAGRVVAGDIVLLATASELDMLGLARAIRAAGAPPGVGWHALFHSPLYRGFTDDFPRQERRLDRLRSLFGKALAMVAPARIQIHVTTGELAEQYGRLGVGPVSVLPYPVRSVERAARSVDRRPLRVVVLGDARNEKGSQHLAAVIERTAADPELAGRLAFAVQSNPGFVPHRRKAGDQAVLRSLERLAELARGSSRSAPPVELLPGPLCGRPYLEQLATADATLLAYDQDRYHCRCSGVLLESLASGVVPIVTGGGSMGRSLAEPLRRHVDALVARSRLLTAETHGPVRVGRGRSWRLAVEPPPGATAVVVTLRWRAPGGETLMAVPAAVELESRGGEHMGTVVAAAADGPGTSAVLPLARRVGPSGPLWLTLTPSGRSGSLDLEEVHVTTIDSGERPAVGAVGLVVPPGRDVPEAITEALREFVRHAGHYLETARRYAPEVAARHCGDRVVEALVAARPVVDEEVPLNGTFSNDLRSVVGPRHEW